MLKMPKKQFKRIIGTTKPVLLMMIDILQAAHDKLHESGGKPLGLAIGDKLLITLEYYRELWNNSNISYTVRRPKDTKTDSMFCVNH